jgi:hypothetical protein
MKMTGCLKIISKMSEGDQEALLARIDQYQADGIPTERAQVMAAQDTLAEIQAERADLFKQVAEQHPDLLQPEAKFSEKRDQTSTLAFKAWSQDAPVVAAKDSSKYPFETGKPVVIESYRGDRTDIPEFDLGRSSGGFFYSDKPVVAQEYAGVLPGTTEPPQSGVMQRNYVRMLNPLFINTRGASFNRIDTRSIPSYPHPISSTDTIAQWAKDQGYDGVIFKDLRDSVSKPGGRNGIPSLVLSSLDPYGAKSAIGNSGAFSTTERDITKSEKREPFYSALERGVGTIQSKAAPAPGWNGVIKGLVAKGDVKADEVEWSGISDWLALQQGKVTKDQVLQFLAGNGVKLEETTLGETTLSRQDAINEELQGTEYYVEPNGDDDLFYFHNGEEINSKDLPQEVWDKIAIVLQKKGEPTKYQGYTLPGGTNYREVLLTLPERPKESWPEFLERRRMNLEQYGDLPLSERRIMTEVFMKQDKSPLNYKSGHWDQPNILAHIRVNDRTDADGKRVLFVEEIQSDWAQQAKKNGFYQAAPAKLVGPEERQNLISLMRYKAQTKMIETGVDSKVARDVINGLGQDTLARASGMADEYNDLMERERQDRVAAANAALSVPKAPFIDKTDKWVALALKRVIKMAVDEGYDKVAFVTGDQSAERYDLSQHVNALLYDPEDQHLIALGKDDRKIIDKKVQPDDLPDVVGKDVAKKLLATELRQAGSGRLAYMAHVLEGLDLKAGGEGMKAFYDKIVPAVAKDVLRKLGGGGMEKVSISLDHDASNNGLKDWTGADGAVIRILRNGGEIYVSQRGQEENISSESELREYLSENGTPDGYFLGDKQGSATQPGFDITPAMREKAAGGVPLFSEKRIFQDNGRAYTPEQRQMFGRIGREVEVFSLKEKLQALTNDMGKRIRQGLVDQFAPLKDLGAQGKKAYALARLSKGAAGAIEAFLHHGKLSLQGDVYDADTTGGVIEHLFKPLGTETPDFLNWVAGNRAERLAREGKENLFSASDISAAKSLDQGTTTSDYTLRNGQVTRDRTLIYRDALKTFNDFNKNVLDVAEQSGLFTGADRAVWEHEFYVPFYRQSEDGAGYVGGETGMGLVRQRAFQALKGGKEKLNSDMLDSTLKNWAHLIDAAGKNRAALASIDAAQQMMLAYPVPSGTKGSVWVMDNGQKVSYTVEDPYTLAAISSLQYAGMNGPVMKILGGFKRALTIGVTSSPAFKIRNLIRDSIASVAISPLSANLLQNLKDGGPSAWNKDANYVSALAGGGLIRFNDMFEGRQADRVRQLVRMGVDDASILNTQGKLDTVMLKAEKALMAYNELGNVSEEINRAALYKQMIAKGLSHEEASLAARDLMDFSMGGTWTTVRTLSQMVPFVNARIQGLYKLGRAAKEDPARMAAVLGAVAGFSIALAYAYRDDKDWKKREDWDRDNFWWFKFGGVALRIPKPFEVGALATLAERGSEFMYDKNMTGSRYGKIAVDLLMDNLSMNPTPQGVKPLLDVYSNKDSFTGRAIESQGMEKLSPDYRYNQGSTMLARGLSSAGQGAIEAVGLDRTGASFLSPLQIDHLLQGYFGWLGAATIAVPDLVLRQATGQPTRPTADYFKVASQGIVQETEGAGSYYVSALYDQAKIIEQAYATFHSLQKTDPKAASAYLKDNIKDISKYQSVEHVKATEAKFNEMIRMIERSAKDPDAKKTEIRRIRQMQDQIARSITEAR